MADKAIISGHWDNFFLSKKVICNIPIESAFPVRKVPSLWNMCDKCHDITQLSWNHNNKKVLSHLFAIFFRRIRVTSRSLSLLHSFPRYYQIIVSRTLVHLLTDDPHSQKSFCDTLKLTSDVYCIFCAQWIYQIAFLNWLREYYFSIDFAMWKSVGLLKIV